MAPILKSFVILKSIARENLVLLSQSEQFLQNLPVNCWTTIASYNKITFVYTYVAMYSFHKNTLTSRTYVHISMYVMYILVWDNVFNFQNNHSSNDHY